ncbi:MAG: hypothetical protein ACJ78Q_13415 [Chloroflexia bacterium]
MRVPSIEYRASRSGDFATANLPPQLVRSYNSTALILTGQPGIHARK